MFKGYDVIGENLMEIEDESKKLRIDTEILRHVVAESLSGYEEEFQCNEKEDCYKEYVYKSLTDKRKRFRMNFDSK